MTPGAGADGRDHLGRADPGQVRARGSHGPVPELPLQNRQGDALAGELDSVRMPKLMWGEAAPDAGIGSEPTKLGTDRGA